MGRAQARPTLRRLLVSLAAILAVAASASPANAHANLVSADPQDGGRVETLDEVSLLFTEEPEPSLSSLTLLDPNGSVIPLGELQVEGRTLRASVLEDLEPSTYLISWRVFSTVDGHVTAGATVFGFQTDAEAVDLPEPVVPGVTPLGLIGRWIFLLGLALLIGSVGIEFLSPLAVRALPRMAAAGAAAALIGVAILGHQQRVDSGGSISAFLQTSIGRAVLWRGVAAGVALVATVAWGKWMRRRRYPALAALVAGLVAAIVHVANGHAGAGGGAQVAAQGVHLVASSLWIGGLLPLLAAVRVGNARRVVNRFSAMALLLVGIVIVSGQLRSFDELGTLLVWNEGSYGRFVLVKWLLLVGILVFAAMNRRTNVRLLADGYPEPLTRAVRNEAILAVFAIGAAAALANISPSAAAGPTQGPARVEVAKTNFAGDVRAQLIADPGRPGPNSFQVTLTDLPEEEPITGADVRLRFRYRGRPGIQPSELELEEQDPGTYLGQGANLAPAGPFEVTVLVQTSTGSDEVVLPVATITEQKVLELGGVPSISSIEFEDGSSVQVYVDPQEPGNAEVHATFFDGNGQEREDLEEIYLVATGPEGVQPLASRRLSPGHEVANLFLTAGTWRFDISTILADGSTLSGWFIREIA